ncbi:MetQ/NlpA family ABC transporter substrate-binding protein [Alkalihalobacillus sp. MEB130]|uniref:MetQ/NlpA family ABC transporter substrate-binding protein n=1 Tax=Alkalihalobacillus sp. MEB130 TaxID=2976704 RepID=UPI0028DECF60|nr:MetQ/NlpA family ABC transporter substrate-binding protein [Alkalihalobacillus sp. MEB130]MDT8859827.1 MetQ/NlpA family ABC transporter substrate-binding protein [Alkalihalobacillus sp. MEB130]
MKKVLISALTALSMIGLAACGGGGDAGTGELAEDQLKVGVTAGPHEQIMEKVIELAAEEGLEIDMTVFTEYVMPNVALDEGELDLNSFQHKPYLDNFKEERNLDLVDVATTVNFPMGIYSTELADVAELQEGDKVGLPNDPTNGARALILFEIAGLITLDPDAGVTATVNDITDNPHNLDFIELEASQIPRQLDELAAAAINTNFAIEHGFVPTEDSIYIEPSDSPWVNVLAVRTENENDAVIQKFIEIYQSEEVKQFIEEEFAGSVVASW